MFDLLIRFKKAVGNIVCVVIEIMLFVLDLKI